MMELKLSIIDKDHNTKATSITGTSMATLVYKGQYDEGDIILLEVGALNCFCELQLDDAMKPAVVYVKDAAIVYEIPFGEKRSAISPKAFAGSCHVLSARVLSAAEISVRRNLALNPYDGFASPCFFPHASANVETRDEAVFAARNAIDGIFANTSHGNFPYESWGINRREDAEWTLEFGRTVTVDELRVTLRADYPHDNYWTELTVSFSDGSVETLKLEKEIQPQGFPIQPRSITALTVKNLKKAALPSPFPALTQLEAWGYDDAGDN